MFHYVNFFIMFKNRKNLAGFSPDVDKFYLSMVIDASAVVGSPESVNVIQIDATKDIGVDYDEYMLRDLIATGVPLAPVNPAVLTPSGEDARRLKEQLEASISDGDVVSDK